MTLSASNRSPTFLREASLIPRILRQMELDLTSLRVVTEAASGAYRFNPALTACAGAEVIAVARDSRFSSAEEAKAQVTEFAISTGVSDRVRVVSRLENEHLAAADIVTNTGFVRPIDARKVKQLKSTAVIPLMWETWEFRSDEVDLDMCHDRGILCLGTDEAKPPLSMDSYAGMLALKLLFDLGLEGYKNRICVIGSRVFPRRITHFFRDIGVNCTWFGNDIVGDSSDSGLPLPITELASWWDSEGADLDALLLAELTTGACLLGDGGLLTPERLAEVNPELRIGVLAGMVDRPALVAAGLTVLPESLAPPHYMSVQLYDMGPAPIMELYAAGLKVGELMARARHSGLDVREAAAKVLEHPLAMDFEGDLSWL